MVYELFKKQNKRIQDKPIVSISNRGVIAFNKRCCETFNLFQYKYCHIYYDEVIKSVLFVFKYNKDENTITVRNRETSVDLYAKSFLSYYNITINKKCLVKKHISDNSLCISLG